MSEHPGAVTVRGKPMTLVGEMPDAGRQAPDCVLLDTGLAPVSLSSLRGRVVVLCSVPSLDTPVCDLETRRFNAEATALGEEVAVAVVSMDLPFAQKRWCGAAGADRVVTLSDHREALFGRAYGVLIKELRLLARAVFVVDRDGVVRYRQLVKEVSQEPDYAPVLEAAREALRAGRAAVR